jgi:1-deoxy-D-xylulose-5-phosphate reductoisomerase
LLHSNTMKRIAILGSTGSIGTQALEVIGKNSDKFEVTVLTAFNNADMLIEQAIRFVPLHVVIGNESLLSYVREALTAYPTTVHGGCDVINDVVQIPEIDMVLTAMVGYAGLQPTINAIDRGKHIALANKETLVVAGDLITELAKKKNIQILPVDSEHSAIYQCLVGEEHNPVEKIYLTASGGPFRGKKKEDLANVGISDALNHPNWCMGSKITIDSASLMNKGLEAIEAKWLFNLKPDQVDVIVHPQSIVHSIVQFNDGSMKAQMGLPDMRLPIQYALAYPNRIYADFERFDFMNYANLTFEKPDTETFRNLQLAYEAMKAGGNVPCILNAANEVAVEAFLQEKITFLDMPTLIEKAIEKIEYVAKPNLNDYVSTNVETRRFTESMI